MSESIRLYAASSLKSALTPLLADFSHKPVWRLTFTMLQRVSCESALKRTIIARFFFRPTRRTRMR